MNHRGALGRLNLCDRCHDEGEPDRALGRGRPLRRRCGDHVAMRRGLGGTQLRGDRLGVLLRAAEEPGQDLSAVLRRQHLGQLDHAGDAELARAERLDDLGEALDQLGRGLPVERRGLGEPELAVKVREQAA